MNHSLQEYLVDLIPARNELCSHMEEYAKENHVPIMDRIGMEALLQILRIHKPGAILEIGCAIGYSAIRMSDALPDAKIVTIERNGERIKDARSFIGSAGKEAAITLLEGDALELAVEAGKHGPFDAIFIDAAKGQYERFFGLYEPFLSPNGIIISDNVLYKEMVVAPMESIGNRRTRALVKKIRHYNQWLMDHPDYDTAILPIGDGMAISKKKEKQ